MLLRMVLYIIFITSSTLNASLGDYFTTISWDWIFILILAILFFLLLLSIIRDNKSRKKTLSLFFEKEKCKKDGEYKYLNEINNERIHSVEKLQSSINSIENSADEEIYQELKRNCKTIFDNNKEEKIFLDISTENIREKNSSFIIKDIITELGESATVEYKGNDLPEKIVADKENILNVLFLLIKLQKKEHQNREPKITIELLSNSSIKIDIPSKLKSNASIEKVLKNGIKPIFNKEDKKYYGIYLYLIKKILNKINGLLTIESAKSSYRLFATIPVDIAYSSNTEEGFNRKLELSKKALIIGSEKTTFPIAKRLKELNFDTTVENFEELNKEIPNFMDFDTIFMESNLFEPILTEYLKSIKPLSHFKLIAITDSKSQKLPTDLIDISLEKPVKQERLYEVIVTLYSSDLIETETTLKAAPKQKSITNSAPQSQKKVLIADDDRVNRHILEYMIKQFGLSVTAVADGAAALKAVNTTSYDLIILDSMMPKLDGYQTISKIRQDSRFNATPVVIHTSFSLYKSSMESIFQLGFDSYLPKPFKSSELKALLNRYVSADIESKAAIETEYNKQNSQEELERKNKEFLAIYSDSDRIIEKYVKENRTQQALSLITDLQEISSQIGANELENTLNIVAANLEEDKKVEESQLYRLSSIMQELKLKIATELKRG
ncbi:MAG TPA: response regulator [Nitratifractor sp.]|nr:response regulator [Nitratifractor sp.]